MKTPIVDFIKNYIGDNVSRFHMPGHKGREFLGLESWDITEISGAGNLYEAEGIIAESEKNASELFGSGCTFYSAGGSSQSIRAMLYLAVQNYPYGKPVVVAARNVHKAFIYAAAMLDFDVKWLYPVGDMRSLCSCEISAEELERTLKELKKPAAAVYITSPDYLGGQADIKALAEVCHRNGTILLVDNAHGAYLKFLQPSQHPLDLGADICCDSAHKTLPVLTGGAYLHISKNTKSVFKGNAKAALEMFGSTSPSYLIMSSLDMCNKYLSEGYTERLQGTVELCGKLRTRLENSGWRLEKTDPLRVTVCAPDGLTGTDMAEKLRNNGVECEFADPDYLVLMVTPENTAEDFERVPTALGENTRSYSSKLPLEKVCCEEKTSIRKALMSPKERVSVKDAIGYVCCSAGVGCPPAIPIAVPGEVIDENAVKMFEYYGVEAIEVVRKKKIADNSGVMLKNAVLRIDPIMERFVFDGREYGLIEKSEFFCVTELTAVCLDDIIDEGRCVPLYRALYVPREDIRNWDPVPAELFCDWKKPVSVERMDKKLNTVSFERV